MANNKVDQAIKMFKKTAEGVDFNNQGMDKKILRISYNNIANDLGLDTNERIEFANRIEDEFSLTGLLESKSPRLARMEKILQRIAVLEGKRPKKYEVYVVEGSKTKCYKVQAKTLEQAVKRLQPKGTILEAIEVEKVFESNAVWTQESAEEFVKQIQNLANNCGITIEITGGVKQRGYSNKDLDLSLNAIGDDPDLEWFINGLEEKGMSVDQIKSHKLLTVELPDGRFVDMFISF